MLDIIQLLLPLSFFCALMVYIYSRLETVNKKRNLKTIDTGVKSKPKSIESYIQGLLDEKDDKKFKQSLILNKYSNKSLPPLIRIKKSLIKLMKNPFNKISVAKVVLFSIVGGAIGAMSGLLLSDGIASSLISIASLTVLGSLVPFTLSSILAVKNQLLVQESNLNIITTHLGIYKECASFLDSLKQMDNIIAKNTREYNIIHKALVGMQEGPISLETTIEILKSDMNADDDVKQYLDTCIVVERTTTEYKEALEYIPERLDPVVMVNNQVVTGCYYCYYVYTALCAISVLTLIYTKVAKPDEYVFYTHNAKGLIGFCVSMIGMLIIGILLGKVANVITLAEKVEIGEEES